MSDDDRQNANSRFDEVLVAYLRRVDEGEQIDNSEFIAAHPDIADSLHRYFQMADQVERFGEPARDETLDASPDTTVVAASPSLTRYFGDYQLLREVARGGMGIVYEARQLTLNRVVAVKMILAGQFATSHDVRRFFTEAEAAAILDHPNIVPIHDVGTHQGQHYFSMAFVEGKSLDVVVSNGPIPAREAASLIIGIAEGVAFAHSKGIIHRDLKPGNVLLDKRGQPRITDFGLAKRVAVSSDITETGTILGTPSYMPPEQATGRVEDVNELSDIYSVGAILYALITGRPPFQGANPVDTLVQVVEQDPVSPRLLNSDVPRDLATICLKCLQKPRRRRYRTMDSLIDDLCRQRDGLPIAARPVSYGERVVRWSKREPVVAVLLSTIFILLITGITTLTRFAHEAHQRSIEANENARLASEAAHRERQARLKVERLADELNIQNQELTDVITKLNTETDARIAAQEKAQEAEHGRGVAMNEAERQESLAAKAAQEANSAAKETERALARGERSHYARAIANVDAELRLGNRSAALQLLDSCDGSLRSWEWEYLSARCASDAVSSQSTPWEIIQHESAVNGVAASPIGSLLASVTNDGDFRVWNTVTGERMIVEKPTNSALRAVAFHPDGELVAAGGDDQQVYIWNLKSVERLDLVGNKAGTAVLLFEDEALFAGGVDGTIRYWNLSDGRDYLYRHQHRGAVKTLSTGMLSGTQELPGGASLLVSVGADGALKCWDKASFVTERPMRAPGFGFAAVGKGPGSGLLTSVGREGQLRWFQIRLKDFHEKRRYKRNIPTMEMSSKGTSRPTYKTETATKTVYLGTRPIIDSGRALPIEGLNESATQSPNGRWLASADDTAVNVWDLKSPTLERVFRIENGHTDIVTSLTWSADSRWLATASVDRTVRIWDLLTDTTKHTTKVLDLAIDAEHQRLVSLSADGMVKLWDCDTRELIRSFRSMEKPVRSLAINALGDKLALGGSEGHITVWELNSAKSVSTFKTRDADVINLTFSPDGNNLAAAYSDHAVLILDATTGREIRTLADHAASVTAITYFKDNTRLASASTDQTIKIWDTRIGKRIREFTEHSAPVTCFTLHPMREQIASGDADGVIQVWEVANGKIIASLKSDAAICRVAFSGDGRRLFTTDGTNNVKTWDPNTQLPILVLPGASTVTCLTHNAADGALIGGDANGGLRFWTTHEGTKIAGASER